MKHIKLFEIYKDGEVTRALFQDNKDAKEYVLGQHWLNQVADKQEIE